MCFKQFLKLYLNLKFFQNRFMLFLFLNDFNRNSFILGYSSLQSNTKGSFIKYYNLDSLDFYPSREIILRDIKGNRMVAG